jgi:hypothetical protein
MWKSAPQANTLALQPLRMSTEEGGINNRREVRIAIKPLRGKVDISYCFVPNEMVTHGIVNVLIEDVLLEWLVHLWLGHSSSQTRGKKQIETLLFHLRYRVWTVMTRHFNKILAAFES